MKKSLMKVKVSRHGISIMFPLFSVKMNSLFKYFTLSNSLWPKTVKLFFGVAQIDVNFYWKAPYSCPLCNLIRSMTIFAEANVDVDLRMLRSFRVLRPLKLVSRIPSKGRQKIYLSLCLAPVRSSADNRFLDYTCSLRLDSTGNVLYDLLVGIMWIFVLKSLSSLNRIKRPVEKS